MTFNPTSYVQKQLPNGALTQLPTTLLVVPQDCLTSDQYGTFLDGGDVHVTGSKEALNTLGEVLYK